MTTILKKYENIYEKIKTTNVTESTAQVQTRLFSSLMNLLNIDEYKRGDLAKFKKITKIIEECDKSISVKKNYFITLFKVAKLEKINQSAINWYEKYMLIYSKKHDNYRDENIVPPEKYIPWLEIKKASQDVNIFNFYSMRDALIMSLYCNNDYITRGEWYSFEIITDNKNVKEFYCQNKNFILWKQIENKFIVYLNNFKNRNEFGPITYTIENDYLNNLLLKWFTEYNKNAKYLIIDIKGNNIRHNTFIKMITEVFTKYLERKCTLQMIRSSYETHLQNSDEYKNATNIERNMMHHKLCHSTKTALQYRKLLKI